MTDPALTIAAELRRRGLATPARLLIDAHRPMAPLLADLGATLGALLRPLGLAGAPAEAAALLDEPDGLDRLLAALGPQPPPAAEHEGADA